MKTKSMIRGERRRKKDEVPKWYKSLFTSIVILFILVGLLFISSFLNVESINTNTKRIQELEIAEEQVAEGVIEINENLKSLRR